MYNPPNAPGFPPGPRPYLGQQQQPYGQPQQPQQAYGQPPQAYGAPPSYAPPSYAPPTYAPPTYAPPLPQVSGLPSAVAFGLGLVAVVVALVCDVVFLKVHIPGVGGYAWYLTTALSFAGAGYFGIKSTRASQATALTAVTVAGVLYGIADLGLGLVLDNLSMSSALFLGIQGLVIAFVCGGGGVRKALSERD